MGGRAEQPGPTPFDADRIYHMNAALVGPSGSASRKRARSTEVSEEAKRLKLSQEPPATGPSNTDSKERMRSETLESSEMAKRPRVSRPSECVCVSCNDANELSDIIQAPCSHHYCTACLVQLVTHAIIDESLFPPAVLQNDPTSLNNQRVDRPRTHAEVRREEHGTSRSNKNILLEPRLLSLHPSRSRVWLHFDLCKM